MCQLSIIIPVYNAEKYIRQCVGSIINQSFRDFELILVDDGSRDSSGSICDSLATTDHRVKALHIPNGGAGNARNRGLDRARGEFVWFVDADDWIEENCLDLFEWENMPDILFFGFNRIVNNSMEKCAIRINPSLAPVDKGLILRELVSRHLFGYTWNKIIRRRVIEDNSIRFRPELILKEDEVFTLEVCRHISTLMVSDITPYNYRILNGSITTSGGRKNMYGLATALEREISHPEHSEPLRRVFLEAIGYYYRVAMREKINDNDINTLIAYYILFIKRNGIFPTLSFKNRCFLRIPTLFLKKVFIRLYSMSGKC